MGDTLIVYILFHLWWYLYHYWWFFATYFTFQICVTWRFSFFYIGHEPIMPTVLAYESPPSTLFLYYFSVYSFCHGCWVSDGSSAGIWKYLVSLLVIISPFLKQAIYQSSILNMLIPNNCSHKLSDNVLPSRPEGIKSQVATSLGSPRIKRFILSNNFSPSRNVYILFHSFNFHVLHHIVGLWF